MSVLVTVRLRVLGGRAIEHPARDTDHEFVNEAFVAGIHVLIDFIDDAEGRSG